MSKKCRRDSHQLESDRLIIFLSFLNSKGELITFDWLCHQMGWPWKLPDTILDLMQLEANHDVLDLYLWLSYRFPVSHIY